MMDIYGPPLPPGFKQPDSGDKASDSNADTRTDSRSQNEKKSTIIGPFIPSHLQKRRNSSDSSDSDISDSSEDKSTRYINKEQQSSNIIGPVLPPGLCKSRSCGSDSDSEFPFGPLPATTEQEGVDDVVATMEKRAKNMKNKIEKGSGPVVEEIKREEWMTTPNTESKNQLGIISRCLADGTEGSKSSSSKRKMNEISKHSKRNEKLSKELKEYNKSKRAVSLVDMHRKAKKRKDKKDASKPKERKPFDRDTELAVRKFSKEQVDSVISKSKYLNSRFKPGASQYL